MTTNYEQRPSLGQVVRYYPTIEDRVNKTPSAAIIIKTGGWATADLHVFERDGTTSIKQNVPFMCDKKNRDDLCVPLDAPEP